LSGHYFFAVGHMFLAFSIKASKSSSTDLQKLSVWRRLIFEGSAKNRLATDLHTNTTKGVIPVDARVINTQRPEFRNSHVRMPFTSTRKDKKNQGEEEKEGLNNRLRIGASFMKSKPWRENELNYFAVDENSK